ncbi:MAG: S53 family peptidase [Thermoplasmata archaeon]|nr:S53 family peptidase [Thermoplasmata archaeon]
MPRRRSALGISALLALVVAVLVLPGPGVTVATNAPANPLPHPTSLEASEIPTPLLAPLAERMGFAPSIVEAQPLSVPASGNVTVVLTLWPSSPTFFLPPGPGTPAYSTSEVADQYGLSTAQYAALEAYFAGKGVAVMHPWPDRMFLTVTGPAADMGGAFGTQEREGLSGGTPVEFADSVPRLPAPFASEVAAVSGLTGPLSDFTLPFESLPDPTPAVRTEAVPAQGPTTTEVTPSAVHLIYGMDALYNYSGSAHWATGVGIALLLWGDGYDPRDIGQFFSTDYPSEFPAPSIHYYPVDGAPSPSAAALQDPSTGPQELTLDIEWAGSQAPGATLDAVYAPDGPASNGYSPTDPSMEDALNTAVNDVAGVKVLSMSFGTLDGADDSFQSAFTTAFHEAELKGITLLAASGDNGGTASKGCSGNVAPQFPAASPDVLAVGGTAPVLSVNAFGAATGLASEPAWNLSGGGFSTDYGAPSWQLVGSAAAPIQASGMRGIPDVAGPASDNVFYYGGQPAYGEGTSFATPMWAGILAEMDAVRGTSLGFVTPHLYSVGAAEGSSSSGGLVDITQGGNCLGAAGPGWDTATGWGSPRALPLFESIAGTYAQVALTATPQPVAPGGTLSVAIAATNATSGRPLAGLSVYFEVDAVSYTGPCGGTLATATGSTDANGTISVGLPVPGCYFGTIISVSVTASGGGYYGSNQTSVAVNLDGLSGLFAALQHFPYNVIGFTLIMVAAVGIGLTLSARHKRRIVANRPPPAAPPPATGPPTSSGTGGPAVVPAAASAGAATSPVVASSASASAPASAPIPAATPTGTAVTSGVARSPAAPIPASGTWCESCDAPVPSGAITCPGCGGVPGRAAPA